MRKVASQSSDNPSVSKDSAEALKLEAGGGVAFMYMSAARLPSETKSELLKGVISSMIPTEDPVLFSFEGISPVDLPPGLEKAGSLDTGSSGTGWKADDVNTGDLVDMGAVE